MLIIHQMRRPIHKVLMGARSAWPGAAVGAAIGAAVGASMMLASAGRRIEVGAFRRLATAPAASA